MMDVAAQRRKGRTMPEKNSHCSYCGTRFDAAVPWPRTCRACSHTTHLNPLPVVVALVPVNGGLVVIRRNIEPRKGTLALPGGYLDLGESWQEGAKREVQEETGIDLSGSEIRLYDVQNGLDDTLVIFGLTEQQPKEVLQPFTSAETQEVRLIDRPVELGFVMHTRVVARYFAEKPR